MDSLFDLCCFYYRKELIDPSSNIIKELEALPDSILNQITNVPTYRPCFTLSFMCWGSNYACEMLPYIPGSTSTGHRYNFKFPIRTDFTRPVTLYYSRSDEQRYIGIDVHHDYRPGDKKYVFTGYTKIMIEYSLN